MKLEPYFEIASSGLSAAPCRFHALGPKIHLFPTAILPGATPAAAEGCCLSASAAAAGSLAAEVPVAIRVAAAEPAASPVPGLNPAARCLENYGSYDVAPACCGCCCRAAAGAHMERWTAAAPVACSLAAAGACPADWAAIEADRHLMTDAEHCAFRDCHSACLDDCCPVPDGSCPAHSALPRAR